MVKRIVVRTVVGIALGCALYWLTGCGGDEGASGPAESTTVQLPLGVTPLGGIVIEDSCFGLYPGQLLTMDLDLGIGPEGYVWNLPEPVIGTTMVDPGDPPPRVVFEILGTGVTLRDGVGTMDEVFTVFPERPANAASGPTALKAEYDIAVTGDAECGTLVKFEAL